MTFEVLHNRALDLKRRVDNAIEKAGGGVIPQVVLGSASVILGVLFGPVGGVIPAAAQAAINARASQIQRDRIETARVDVGEQLSELDEEKIDQAFVESDAFFDWVCAGPVDPNLKQS